MRQDTISLGLKWLNPSTANSVCTAEIPPFDVPLGPTVVGVTMSQPSAGTYASAVPGEAGTTPMSSNIVPAGSLVHVFAEVFDTTIAQLGVKNVWLFYFTTTNLAEYSPTAFGTYNPANATGGFTNYTGIPMTWQGGNTYRTYTPIPSSENSNVWFFVLAVDNDDNFDRAPEATAGAFQYYEQQGNVCNNIPGSPGVVKTETSSPSAKVSLALTKPALNADGTTCTDFRAIACTARRGARGPGSCKPPTR